VSFRIDQNWVITALEEMPCTAMPAIEPLRVNAVEPTHPGRQIRPGSLQQQVVVIAHQAEAVASPAEIGGDISESHQEALAIAVVHEDESRVVATRRDVVERSLELDAWWPRHDHSKLAGSEAISVPSLKSSRNYLVPGTCLAPMTAV
jgi:hypothetical protein